MDIEYQYVIFSRQNYLITVNETQMLNLNELNMKIFEIFQVFLNKRVTNPCKMLICPASVCVMYLTQAVLSLNKYIFLIKRFAVIRLVVKTPFTFF